MATLVVNLIISYILNALILKHAAFFAMSFFVIFARLTFFLSVSSSLQSRAPCSTVSNKTLTKAKRSQREFPLCDALTRWLDDASRSRSGHGREGATDTCTTRCRKLLHGSDAASFETRAGGHLWLLECSTDTGF